MTEPTIAAGYPKALLDFAVGKGADRSQLLQRSGIVSGDLQNQDQRVPLRQHLALIHAAIELCREPALALQFGAAVLMPEVSIVGLIGAAAPTVGEAHDQLNRYARLNLDPGSTGTPTRLDIVRDRAGVWLVLAGSLYVDHPQLTEAAFANWVSGARSLLGHTAYFQSRTFPRAIHFAHAEPRHRAEYERIFRVPLVFGSKRNALLIDEEFLAVPLPPTNRYVFGVLSERAQALLERLENSRTVRGNVERLLIPMLHTGNANMQSVCDRLGLSRQTLFRQLRAEGVTFAEVLDELRHKMALHYLNGRKVSVNETAYLVGFSDPAAFSRAFKRWTGASPRARRT